MLKDDGVTTFSITDHDTVEGNVEAAALAEEHELTHINGIELSCCFADGELGLDESWVIHILGYGLDLELMRGKLTELDNKKHTQLRELFDLLVADGYNIDLQRIAQDGKIAERTHIAKELIRQSYAVDGNEAFSKILNTERYRSYAKYKPTIKEGIKIIHDCGGLAVWAHPFGVTRGGKKELTEAQVSVLLKSMFQYGIDGVEVYYQQYTSKQIEWLNEQVENYKLRKTVGTDYHNAKIDLNKYPEYAEAKKRERLAFDVVEVEPWFDAKLLITIPKKSPCPSLPLAFVELLQDFAGLKVDIAQIHGGTYLGQLAAKGLADLDSLCRAIDYIMFTNHAVMSPDMFEKYNLSEIIEFIERRSVLGSAIKE